MTLRFRLLPLSCYLLLCLMPIPLIAQTSDRGEWWDATHKRIRAIYQTGELNRLRYDVSWLADSSGYQLQSDKRVVDVQTGQTRSLTDAERDSQIANRFRSPDGQCLLQYSNRDLVVRQLDGDTTKTLIERPKDRDLHFDDPRWSPDSKRIIFRERDSTNVRQRAVIEPTDPTYPKVRYDRFARVGEQIEAYRVGVIDVTTGKLTWMPLETPAEGFYLGHVDWAANSKEVVIEWRNRFRTHRKFLLINIDSQNVDTIFEESGDAWVEDSRGRNIGPIWFEDGQKFVVLSEQDGWRHAYLYNRAGKKLAVLTPGEYDIIEWAALDEQRDRCYFYASPENGTQRYLYQVPLDGSGSLRRVSPADQPGTHDYDFSPDSHWAIHTYSNINAPPVIDLVELPSHRSVRTLERNEHLFEQLNEWIPQPTEFVELTIEDGTSMDAWVIKPRDFDSSMKYPVFVYVYGEPYNQTVLDQWDHAYQLYHHVIADLGYIVISIDNRGTPAPKGTAWRRSIYNSLGPLSTEEQAAALQEFARSRPYVDLDRVGIWGWSGGGSNTLNALFRKPDIYHVGIAVVPKPQPHLYNAWFQEIYMRDQTVNPDGYQQSAPINFADGLLGDLLIVTGSGETNTHVQIIEGLLDKLIALGKPFDYFVYPNRNHGLREGVGSKPHVRMLILRYLVEHLPRGPRPQS